jgi:competence protein ComEC
MCVPVHVPLVARARFHVHWSDMAVEEPLTRPKRVTAIALEREIRNLGPAKGIVEANADTSAPKTPLSARALVAVQASLAAGHGPAWLVSALGAGIVIYFALPAEPQLWALLAAMLVLATISWRVRYAATLYPILMLLALVSGVALVAGRAQINPTPQLLAEAVQMVEGHVRKVEQRSASRARLTLDQLVLEDQTQTETPHRARITVIAQAGAVLPGQTIRVLARLGPPPEPVMPGARNMRRELFFANIGATGFSYGRPTVVAEPSGAAVLERVERVRLTLASRFAEALPGDAGILAATLLVGKRDGLSDETYEALRRAGLAHLLAISGMHMAMMTLSAIAVLHLLLAASPKLSASHRATRWAAFAGLAIASGYLLLSGAGTATQRAFVMIVLALLAVVLARRALTIRAVAFAAFLVLALHPENLLGPSFQMSFAATLALVSVYGALNTSKTAWRWRLKVSDKETLW